MLIDKTENSLLFNNMTHKILSKDEVKQYFIDKGFVFLKDLDTGAHHYGIILKKKNKKTCPVLNFYLLFIKIKNINIKIK